jgi:cyclophilin family peptidyl-prolyl cis-trans isomerase
MKKKNKLSLTAKERKELSRPEQAAPLSEEEIAARAQLKAKNRKRRNYIIKIIALCLALLLGLGAIGTGIYFIVRPENIDNEKINPLASISLSNGKKLEVELFYNDSKAAVANFIYLSQNNYFDDTMFSNNKNNFLAFNGMTDIETSRANDTSFLESLKGFVGKSNVYNTTNYKLGYRIRTVSNYKRPSQLEGYLCMVTGTTYGTSTTFVLITDNSPQINIKGQNLFGSGTTSSTYLTFIGRVTGDSLQEAKRIAALGNESTPNPYVSDWSYPADYKNNMIKDITFSNLNKKLNKRILDDFENFVINPNSTDEDAIKGGSSTSYKNMDSFTFVNQ